MLYEVITITTVVEQLNERSTLTPVSPDGKVYGYMNIWAGNEGIATPENIENAAVGFKVDKSWVSENDIDSNSLPFTTTTVRNGSLCLRQKWRRTKDIFIWKPKLRAFLTLL